MEIYVTRHGESISNIDNLVCGHSDVNLTRKGINQAKSLAKVVDDLKIDKIITSPLIRAYDTAKMISNHSNIPLTVDNRLIEFNFGNYEGLQVNDQKFLRYRNQLSYKMPNGESVLEAAQRIYNLLDEVEKEDRKVLLVCHNAISRVINSYFTSVSNSEFYDYNLDNCELVKFTF